MYSFLRSFLIILLLMSFALGIQAVMAEEKEPIQELEDIIGKSGLSKGERIHKLSSVDPGADIITSTIFTAIDFLKYLLGTVAVLYTIFSGIKLIMAGKKIDEISEKEKESLKYIIYGLILVIIADQLVTKVFFGDYGECLASASNAAECAKFGSGLIKGIYSFILSILATLAVFVLVVSGFRMVTAYGNEEDINKQKKRILISIAALLIAGVGEFTIKNIVFPQAGTRGIDVVAAQKLVANLTNFVSAFVGTAAFAMLFYGGYLYVAAFGNEEGTQKAKKIIFGSLIGILIALAAYAIVTTLTTTLSTGGKELGLPTKLPGR